MCGGPTGKPVEVGAKFGGPNGPKADLTSRKREEIGGQYFCPRGWDASENFSGVKTPAAL